MRNILTGLKEGIKSALTKIGSILILAATFLRYWRIMSAAVHSGDQNSANYHERELSGESVSNGHRFASNLFSGVAVVSVVAAVVAAAILFVPVVTAFAAPVTGFLASKFGSLFAAYSIPHWLIPVTFAGIAAVSGIVSSALKP